MKSIRVLGMVVLGIASSGTAALAKTGDTQPTPIVPLPRAGTLADNVVVTPGSPAAPPAAVPEPVAQPVAVQPVEAAPRRTTVVEDSTPRNYMSTIAVSALMGAVLGGLIGGSIYYLDGRDHPARIAYWAAGGVLVGTGVGLIQVVVQEGRADAAVASRFPTDPAPTHLLALRMQF